MRTIVQSGASAGGLKTSNSDQSFERIVFPLPGNSFESRPPTRELLAASTRETQPELLQLSTSQKLHARPATAGNSEVVAAVLILQRAYRNMTARKQSRDFGRSTPVPKSLPMSLDRAAAVLQKNWRSYTWRRRSEEFSRSRQFRSHPVAASAATETAIELRHIKRRAEAHADIFSVFHPNEYTRAQKSIRQQAAIIIQAWYRGCRQRRKLRAALLQELRFILGRLCELEPGPMCRTCTHGLFCCFFCFRKESQGRECCSR
eukprot:m.609396 g.609396  ORF g.609396 m.609396 type:complete len:261 (+) comp58129_c0_seq2:1579-2361(+)